MSDSETFVTTNNVNFVVEITYYFYVTEIKEITIEGPHEKNKTDEECTQNFVVEPPENPKNSVDNIKMDIRETGHGN
jgi:hypothetical protein